MLVKRILPILLLLLPSVACGQCSTTVGSHTVSGVSGGCSGVPVAVLQSIGLSPTSTTVPVGQQGFFTATGTYSDNSTADVTLQCSMNSSNVNVATIGAAADPWPVNAVGVGSANVSCTIGSIVGTASVITVAQLVINTGSMQNAQVGTAYSGAISAAGGTGPYTWTITVGAAALSGIGLTLDGSTTLTTHLQGTPSGNAGSPYAFTIQIQDSASHTATANLQLIVNPAGAPGCGPPNYSCTTTCTTDSCTGTPLPIAPYFAANSPVNSTTHDPTLNPSNDCITRLTDASTFSGQSSGSTSSGGDNDVMSSVNTTYMGVGISTGSVFLFKLDPTGSCIQVVNPAPGGQSSLHVPHPFGFSRATDTVFYHLNTTNGLQHYSDLWKATIRADFSGFDEVKIFDYKNCPGTPANGAGVGQSASILAIGLNDAYFGVNLSWTGGQGTAINAYVYRASDGACAAIDLSTGNWWTWCVGACSNQAPSGTESACLTSGIHDSQMSLDGAYQWISAGCTANQGQGFGVWQVATGNVAFCAKATNSDNCEGHNSEGVSHHIVHTSPYNIRANTNVHSYTNFYSQLAILNETHGFWPHPTGDDSYPWISAGGGKLPACVASGGDYTRPPAGCAEIFASYPNSAMGTPAARFAHTNLTGQNDTVGPPTNVSFPCRYGIGWASQDGKWFFWLTMDLNNLGFVGGTFRCDLYGIKLE